MSLCYRCEHRAEAHENGSGPRYECTDFSKSVSTCYMYWPTKPAILKRVKGDKRVQFGSWQFGARSTFTGVCDNLKLDILDYKRKGKALIWVKREGKQ